MASGLIYLAIAGMWVAYFLPQWVHNRDEFSGKSVERYKSALRVVASSSGQVGSSVIYSDLDHEAKTARLLARRRFIFGVLSTTLAFTLVGGVMKTMAWVISAIPATGILMYVAHVRRAIHAEQISKRRVDALHRNASGISTTNFAEVIAPRESKDHWIPLSERELTGVTLLPKGSAALRNEWKPTDIPVPTYVNAPKAVVPKRIIDLTEPGRWSDEQERLAREALAAAAPSRDEVFDQQLADEAVTRLQEIRAVNE